VVVAEQAVTHQLAGQQDQVDQAAAELLLITILVLAALQHNLVQIQEFQELYNTDLLEATVVQVVLPVEEEEAQAVLALLHQPAHTVELVLL
jgi:hypothetical protein